MTYCWKPDQTNEVLHKVPSWIRAGMLVSINEFILDLPNLNSLFNQDQGRFASFTSPQTVLVVSISSNRNIIKVIVGQEIGTIKLTRYIKFEPIKEQP